MKTSELRELIALELKKAKKDYDGDGKIESPKDEYMGSRDKAIKKAMSNEDLDIGHQDDEPGMLKADLYRIAKYASELYKYIDQFDQNTMEVDFPQWWQEKIIRSKNDLVAAKHYLDYELKKDSIDSSI